MFKLNKIQKKITKLTAVFNNIIDALNDAICQLNDEIAKNEDEIITLRGCNAIYGSKIKEYEALRENVESIVK